MKISILCENRLSFLSELFTYCPGWFSLAYYKQWLQMDTDPEISNHLVELFCISLGGGFLGPAIILLLILVVVESELSYRPAFQHSVFSS